MILTPQLLGVPAAAPSGDWWLAGGAIDGANVISAYSPKGAASLADSYVNLINSATYTLAVPADATWSAPTLGSDGWAFVNASNQRLESGVAFTYPVSWAFKFIVDTSVKTSKTGGFFGIQNGYNNNKLSFHPSVLDTTAKHGWAIAVTTSTKGAPIPSGVVIMTNGATLGGVGYIDGVQDQTGSGDGDTRTMFIGGVRGRYIYDGALQSCTGSISHCAFFNIELSASQVTALTNAMASL